MKNIIRYGENFHGIAFPWQGECKDNVIPGSLLSSGYYEYEATGAEEYIVPKPEDAGEYLTF